MKSTLLAIAFATAGLVVLPISGHAATDKGGMFINGNIGQSDVNKRVYDDSDTAYGFNVGYRWALSPAVALGVEGGYTDLGKFSPKNSAVANLPANEFLRDARVKGWTAGVNGHFNMTDNWYFSARTGLMHADVKGDWLDPAGLPVSGDKTRNKMYAGAGFGYDFSNQFSVGLNYDYYKVDSNRLDLKPSMLSVSAEARF